MVTECNGFLQHIAGTINSLLLPVFFFIALFYTSLSVPACFPPGFRSRNCAARRSWQEGLGSEQMLCPPRYHLLRGCRKESGGAQLGQLDSHQKSTSSFLVGLDRDALKESVPQTLPWGGDHHRDRPPVCDSKASQRQREAFPPAVGLIPASEGKRNVLDSCPSLFICFDYLLERAKCWY